MYIDILNAISDAARMNFEDASALLENYVNKDAAFVETLKQIGTIPEFLAHDSTEEKLFSKASDAVLSRAFREIGLKSTVLKERGDSADVLAESPIYGYTLVADAKAFRMSRTAKNQKDFKVKETTDLSFSPLWAFCDTYSHEVLHSDMKKCFIPQFNATLLNLIGLSNELLVNQLKRQIVKISERGNQEKLFWQEEIKKIECYSKEEAISELIKAKKIHEKIAQIDIYIKGLQI